MNHSNHQFKAAWHVRVLAEGTPGRLPVTLRMINFQHWGQIGTVLFIFFSSSIQSNKSTLWCNFKTDSTLTDAAKWSVLKPALACLSVCCVCDVGRRVHECFVVHMPRLEDHFVMLILFFYLYMSSRVWNQRTEFVY